MRSIVLCAFLGLVGAAVATPPELAHAQDFDPSGRRRRPKPKVPGAAPAPRPRPPAGATPPAGTRSPPPAARPTPAPDAPARPAPADGAEGTQNRDKLIERYTKIALEQPSAPFPIQRLAQLYRERDGNLDKLVAELEARAAQPGDAGWPARVALAGVLRQDGQHDKAIAAYERAAAEKPKDPGPLLAIASMRADRGDKAGARAALEKALPVLTVPADVEQTRRTLMGLCLDLGDFDAARAHHAELVKRSQGSLFVKAELGRELMARGLFERAEPEFRDLVRAAAGDNRALAPALRDLGAVLARQKKMTEAVDVLKRALGAAGGATGVRSEIYALLGEAFRAEGRLPELVKLLESEGGQDAQRQALLGGLYEETGAVDKAIATYRKILAADTRNVDVRIRLVHLLQTAGELDAAVGESEALVRAAPQNPDFVFELAETLIARGERDRALKVLGELEQRAQGEPETLAAVADFYERTEEKARAMKVRERLAQVAGGDPTYLVDLGDRHWQEGDKKRALETWARIKQVVPNRARAAAALGEVYLEHDMGDEAIAAFREAVAADPQSRALKKQLAMALERTASGSALPGPRFAEATTIWEQLLKDGGTDKALAREARQHVVALWSITKELASKLTPLRQRFEAKPPDLEAGRLLAEVQRKLHRLPDAEATLRALVKVAPGDEEALLALERVLVQQQNLPGAIEVLKKLAAANPKGALQYYQRMAQYAAEAYRDDEAVEYATRAVELSPADANANQKLGDMHRRRQDVPRAIAEYRQAIKKNDRLFPVYLDLAELLLSQGEVDEADRLLRRVVRSSKDDELVARAARASMQIHLGRGSLEVLERELLPVAVGNPQKPLYRRLLVELYGVLTLPLVQKARAGDEATAREARGQLAAIGARAVKPLLDALGDDAESQQRIAIEVLSHVANESAGPSLFAYATGKAERGLRVRAMVAAGALGSAELLPRFEALLVPKDEASAVTPGDDIAVAAAWAVARLAAHGEARAEGRGKARALLRTLLAAPSTDVRGVAAAGLALGGDPQDAPRLAALARAPEAGPSARAAALLAVGLLPGKEGPELVASSLESPEPALRRAALVTAGRLVARGALDRERFVPAVARAAAAADPELRHDAVLAAAVAFGGAPAAPRDPLAVPSGPVTAAGVSSGLRPPPAPAAARARAFVVMAPALATAARSAVSTSSEQGAALAVVLGDTPGAPFVAPGEVVDPAITPDLARASESIASATVPGFVALARHPDPDVRARAVTRLAPRAEPDAQRAVAELLERDRDDEVRRAALAALGPARDPATMRVVARLARAHAAWPVRVRAAEALGRLAAAGPAASPGAVALAPEATAVLAEVARRDPYALVREAAARALAAVDPAAAAPVLGELAGKDPEPRLRRVAAELLAARRAAVPR